MADPVTGRRAARANRRSSRLTIEEFIEGIIPGIVEKRELPDWPPDAFALAASLLHRSGGYIFSSTLAESEAWSAKIIQLADDWNSSRSVPSQVASWWLKVLEIRTKSPDYLRSSRSLSQALIGIAATADEASAGFGLPPKGSRDRQSTEAFLQLWKGLLKEDAATLCKRVSSSRLSVLPKFHTPRTGLTLRSITHHLALFRSGEIIPRWMPFDWTFNPSASQKYGLNLLLVPWPDIINPSVFQMGKTMERDEQPRWGYFDYGSNNKIARISQKMTKLMKEATRIIGRIDGVILPELALKDDEPRKIFEAIRKINTSCFLLSGVYSSPRDGNIFGLNQWKMFCPIYEETLTDQSNAAVLEIYQGKHHRWKLDRKQVEQYGLGGSLDPRCSWWENTRIENREIWFLAFYDWLTICPLICEDLARQDPMADLIRAVGPNLVIALLMDGPQLKERWPARYATVLAEDPGSSVLTLTSVGMAELCRPAGKEISRKIALWKDAKSGDTIEIELPPAHDAVVVCLAGQMVEEWTSDGRRDNSATGSVQLSGIHPIKAR